MLALSHFDKAEGLTSIAGENPRIQPQGICGYKYFSVEQDRSWVVDGNSADDDLVNQIIHSKVSFPRSNPIFICIKQLIYLSMVILRPQVMLLQPNLIIKNTSFHQKFYAKHGYIFVKLETLSKGEKKEVLSKNYYNEIT